MGWFKPLPQHPLGPLPAGFGEPVVFSELRVGPAVTDPVGAGAASGRCLTRRALGEAVATALAVRDGAPSTGPAPTYAQVLALVDEPGVTCR
ncbi:hypothetical protein ACFWU3_36355 [Streptomyces sp. NPDC058685]|uniref:hypothetical protein n=1 Tax=Streptomyces sp. NPDC058685 TaxID=3346598 RepID=UPI0036520BAC